MFAISIAVPPVAITWIGLSLLIGLLALAKRRSFTGWMAASMLFTPFFAVVLFFLPRANIPVKTKPTAIPPPLPTRPSLLGRVAAAAKFRVRQNGAANVLAEETRRAHRSLDNFTELERDIKQSVQSRLRSNGR